jgi:uncharacterized membrane protein YoaK (UPF0700 family)
MQNDTRSADPAWRGRRISDATAVAGDGLIEGSARRALIPWLHHVPALYLITGVCGLIDATSFLSFGEVFVELVTGNLVFMAFYIGTGHPVSRFGKYVEVVVAFAIGAILGGRLLRKSDARPRLGFFVEWGLLILALLVTVMFQPGQEGPARWVVVTLLAVAMGVQNALIRRHAVPDLATNVMTLTFTGLLAETRLAGGTNQNWRRRFGSVAIFVVGATLGALLTTQFGPWAPLTVAVLLFTIALAGLTVPSPERR